MELLVQKRASLYTLNWGMRLNVLYRSIFDDLILKKILILRKKGAFHNRVPCIKKTTCALLEGPA